MPTLQEFLMNLRPFEEPKFIDNARLRAESVSYVGIPYADRQKEMLVLDCTPFVGRQQRLEFANKDVLAALKLPDKEVAGEMVPVVRVYVRRGAVGVLVRTFVVSREPSADLDPGKRLEVPLQTPDQTTRPRVFEEFEDALAGLPVSAPPGVGAVEMHVTCDAGHTDNDLLM
jgi:hypothetical protein